MPTHPEGEDQSTERVEIVHCLHCHAQVPVLSLAPVNDFACPQCGGRIPVDNKANR
jgi:DNA-directed RNA polymerase subunit RPC12/RpoP